MNRSAVYTISVLGLIGAAFLLVYGAALPFLKSQAYINAVSKVSSVRTISDFENIFNSVYNFPSPVGDEETTKYLLGNVAQIAQTQNEAVDRELADYVEPHIIPTDTRHLVSAANLRTIMLALFKKQTDYDKAVGYYEQARAIGPKLPPVLYNLFQLYNAAGDKAKAQEVASVILKYWPQDTRVTNLLAGK